MPTRLLITMAQGQEFNKLLTLTGPYMMAYAEKCEATYIAIHGNPAAQWSMENKFRAWELAKQFDQTLWVDADCWIKPTCPNIFDFARLAMHNDKPFIDEKGFGSLDEYNAVMVSQGLQPVGYLPKMLGAGVVLCTKATADVWKPPANPLPPTHCAEQCWVQYQARALGCFDLPIEYNTQAWFKGFKELLPKAHIVHLASVPHRYDAMRNLIQGND